MAENRSNNAGGTGTGRAARATKAEKLRAVMEALDFDPKAPLPAARGPKCPEDCVTMQDLANLVFRRVRLDGRYQMLFDSTGSVVRLVWPGKEFTDKVVSDLAKLLPQIGDKEQLKELRLVGTRITCNTVEAIRQLLPRASVVVVGDVEANANWQWSQANYPDGDEARLQMNSTLQP